MSLPQHTWAQLVRIGLNVKICRFDMRCFNIGWSVCGQNNNSKYASVNINSFFIQPVSSKGTGVGLEIPQLLYSNTFSLSVHLFFTVHCHCS